MGLLDGLVDPEVSKMMQASEEDKRNALNNALIQGGLSMMANSYNRGGRFAPAFGAGGMAGMQQYQQGLEQSRQDKLGNLKLSMTLQDVLEKQKQRKAREAALANDPNIPEEVRAGLVPFDEYWKRQNPQDQYKVVGNSMVKVGGGQVSPVFTAPDKSQALPWYVRRGEDGSTSIDPVYAEFEKMKAAYGRQPAQPMAPVAYVDDTGKTVWGTITEAKGKPAANFSPALQGQIAGAKEGAKVTAKAQTEAAFDAPRVIQNAETAIKNADELLKHPGFEQAVGASSMLGVQKVPGTQARDFMNRLDQIKGGAFLEAFNSLKGGGQITEVEGKKATDAIARMDNATSEKEFRQAVEDYKDIVRRGVSRAKMRAGNAQAPSQPAPTGGAKFLGFE